MWLRVARGGANGPTVFRTNGRDRGARRDNRPENESPVGAMPQAAEKHGDQKIAVDQPGLGSAAAPERNIEIVAEAGRERNVPAAPEIGDVEGFVGRIEILRQANPEQIAK